MNINDGVFNQSVAQKIIFHLTSLIIRRGNKKVCKDLIEYECATEVRNGVIIKLYTLGPLSRELSCEFSHCQ